MRGDPAAAGFRRERHASLPSTNDLLRDYAAGTWQPEYRQPEKPSMHDSPLPRFDLLQIHQYRTMTIQFARGCPFNCEFCDIIEIYGRVPRTKTNEFPAVSICRKSRFPILWEAALPARATPGENSSQG